MIENKKREDFFHKNHPSYLLICSQFQVFSQKKKDKRYPADNNNQKRIRMRFAKSWAAQD